MDVLETRTRGEVPTVVGRRPETGGRGNNSECKHSSPFPCPPACTRDERRPRHFSLPFNSWGASLPPKLEWKPDGTDAPRARRPVSCTATTDACVRRCRAAHRLAAIVRSPICSAANRCTVASGELSASICVICGFFRCDGGRSSCLRVFVFATGLGASAALRLCVESAVFR
jgi:hypothetical protein